MLVSSSESNAVPAKRKKEEENKEDILEMVENTENPLRCPVRLYEFYLSKWWVTGGGLSVTIYSFLPSVNLLGLVLSSELVRQRTNMFYLHPERCCVPNSPLWFSSTPLDNDTMDAMLTRVLTVRELHPKSKRGRRAAKEDPPFVPEDEEEDSDWRTEVTFFLQRCYKSGIIQSGSKKSELRRTLKRTNVMVTPNTHHWLKTLCPLVVVCCENNICFYPDVRFHPLSSRRTFYWVECFPERRR